MDSTELQEAVNAATAATSVNVIQKVIDTNILEYQRRFSPLLAAIPTKKWNTNTYFFVQRNKRPSGGAAVDGGARANSNSVWAQNSFTIKNYLLQTGVTGFAQAVTAGVVGDLVRQELDGGMQSQLWALETSLLYANAAATLGLSAIPGPGPDMDGLDTLVSTYSGGQQNVINATGKALALNSTSAGGSGTSGFGLDDLIDLVEENIAAAVGGRYMFIGSPKAINRVGGLMLNQQRFVGSTDVAVGLSVPTYRDIAMVKSSFLAARGTTFGTVAPSAGGTGGTLATGTYYYQVSAVINRFGETQACTEVSQAVTSGQNVTLTFTTPSDSEGNEPILYKVYRGSTSGSEVLVGVVASADDQGNAVTSIVDTGANLLVNGRAQTGQAPWPTTYAGGGGLGNQKPRAAGTECLYLVPRDEDFMCRPFVRDFQTLTLAQTSSAPDVMPFAILNDTCLAVRAPKYVARLENFTVAL